LIRLDGAMMENAGLQSNCKEFTKREGRKTES